MDAVRETEVEEQLHPRHGALDRFRAYRKWVQGWSKVRRYWLSKFRPAYVARMRRQRRGECLRCGSCCNIMFKCPHLENGSHCVVYDGRATQCRNFPIDHRDLRYLEDACGFHFVRDGDSQSGVTGS